MHQDGDCSKNDHEYYADETCSVCFGVDDPHVLHLFVVLHSHDGWLGIRNTRLITHENIRRRRWSLHTVRMPDCSSRAFGDAAFASLEAIVITVRKQSLELTSFSHMANVVDAASIHQPRVWGDGWDRRRGDYKHIGSGRLAFLFMVLAPGEVDRCTC